MKTTTIDMISIENIPQELRDRRSWVTWRSEDQGGRTVKPPFNPRTSRKAKSNDPTTWGSFDEATTAYEGGGYDGIGFQLTPPFVGVDLDKCRDPATGVIDDWAQAIIEQLNSYTEVSPSGTGIHILVRGDLPPGGRRTKGVELYDRDRYFTVTGKHVEGTRLTVEPRKDELHALHGRLFVGKQLSKSPVLVEATISRRLHASTSMSDKQLLARIGDSNDDLFERLWNGKWSSEYPSQSEADLALCAKLAFWTGKDADRMDRLFRQSGLYRPKWERQDYRERTLGTAVRKTYAVWSPPQPLGQVREARDD